MSYQDRVPPTVEEYADYPKRFSNWGRWGDDDELGTLNFITPQVRKASGAAIRQGESLSLMRPINTRASKANPYPPLHMVMAPQSMGLGDHISLFVHSFVDTHIDALCHATTPDGQLWNGRPGGPHGLTTDGAAAIDHLAGGVVTRGVLYDVPRFRGTDYVKPGEPVHGWELADIAEAQGVTPQPGDAVVIRSGYAPFWADQGGDPEFASVTGVHASVVEFLYETQASILLWDFQDAPETDQGLPNPLGDIPISLHVHNILLPYMGMPIVDNCDLEGIAEAAARESQWDFQLMVAPLKIVGATGSPVNPIAVL